MVKGALAIYLVMIYSMTFIPLIFEFFSRDARIYAISFLSAKWQLFFWTWNTSPLHVTQQTFEDHVLDQFNIVRK